MKLLYRIAILLAIGAVELALVTGLTNMFNAPVFPGEAQLAFILWVLVVLGTVQLILTLFNRWKKADTHEAPPPTP